MQAQKLLQHALTAAVSLTLLAACQSDPRQPPSEALPATVLDQPKTVQTQDRSALPSEIKLEAAAAEAVQKRTGLAASAPAAPGRSIAELDHLRAPSQPIDREHYAHLEANPIRHVAEHPVSTFSIDVDTGSYANMRRFLSQGRLPVHDAVRIEEMINYFGYDYAAPRERTRPFNVITEIAPTPWNRDTHLLLIGIKGYELHTEKLPPANLVFLIDVSGSMQSPDKLPLLKSALKLLSERLRPQDRVSMVVYAGGTGVVLEPTPGNERAKVHAALDALKAGGRTNGAAGIELAYAMAEQGFIAGGVNRVLLATDGDFNVGTVDFEALKNLIEDRRRTGISLTTLGFGTGNYNDHLMEQLADAGNGNYAYIDTLKEANKVLVNQMSGTLATIAKDVKIQVEFNPRAVAEYRLIGYENRALTREDFANDKVDAGEIGAGHSVTALYEIALVGSKGQRLEPLRYGAVEAAVPSAKVEELAFLRLRYKAPDGDKSMLIEKPLSLADAKRDLRSTSGSFRFAAAVAAFGQLLKGGKYTGDMGFPEVVALANGARGEDRYGYRGEFIQLVNLAQSLSGAGKQARGE